MTLGNLFSGTLGVISIVSENYSAAALCILISLILDFLDGFTARALHSHSNLGAQLDSLADMVSFGVLPGVAMYKTLEPFGAELLGIVFPFSLKYIGLLITLFSCVRLAVFNLDQEQTYYFKGLNTPSNTLLIFGLIYSFQENESLFSELENPLFLVLLSLLSSWLLISPIKMIAIKFKSKLLKDNYPKLVLLTGALFILLLFGWTGLPLTIVFYLFTSLIFQKQL